MKKSIKLPNWVDVYPQGTQEGDEEQAFFCALSRSKWTWRSTAALSKEAHISMERVDEIIQKYWKLDMVYQNPANEDQWGYWTRVFEENPLMEPKEEVSITQKDHNDRMKKAAGI